MTAGQVIVDDAMVLARTEEDQLELAVRQHAQLVYRIAYSVLRNHHDAEDATQETFVRVLRAKRKLTSVDDPAKMDCKNCLAGGGRAQEKVARNSYGNDRSNRPLSLNCGRN